MFNKDQVSVIEWLFILIIITIPIVNIIFIFYILLNRNISKTIANLVYAVLILFVVAILLLGFLSF